MKLTISAHHFEELLNKGYSTDQYIMLALIYEQVDVSEMCEKSPKLKAIHNSLIRKGLISDVGDKITIIGNEIITFMATKDSRRIVKHKTDDSDFKKWWNTFPGTDNFQYKGKTFQGSRSLRKNESECRIKFDKIVIVGEYTAQQLINALLLELSQKKEASIKQGCNKLSYMQNSLTYLNQNSYIPYIELLSEGTTITETQDKYDGINL